MGCDLLVARGRAKGNGRTVFGHSNHRPTGEPQRLVQLAGRRLAPGEMVQTQHLQLPQARETYAVLGSQPEGFWGLPHGVNEHQLAVGCATWTSRLGRAEPGLTGPDLVRLALERCRTARQALDLMTGLISRHGQGDSAGQPTDSVFLLADPSEAIALEAAANGWVVQEVLEARAASDVALVRQDWDRIAPGLAEHVISLGWWQADGSKLDFAGSLSAQPTGQASALRRWGRATVLLEQQSGHLDSARVRRILADHYEGTRFEADPARGVGEPVPLCRHGLARQRQATAASLVVELGGATGSRTWFAFGPPCVSVYFPVFLGADLPTAFAPGSVPGGPWRFGQQLRDLLDVDPAHWQPARKVLRELQARFDQDAADLLAEAARPGRTADPDEARRACAALMQSQAERFEDAVQDLLADLGGSRLPALVQ
jgi:dipeptidase